MKQKPWAAEEAFQSIVEDFTHLVEKCCHAERREMCFQEEVSIHRDMQRGCGGHFKENAFPIATVKLATVERKDHGPHGWE